MGHSNKQTRIQVAWRSQDLSLVTSVYPLQVGTPSHHGSHLGLRQRCIIWGIAGVPGRVKTELRGPTSIKCSSLKVNLVSSHTPLVELVLWSHPTTSGWVSQFHPVPRRERSWNICEQLQLPYTYAPNCNSNTQVEIRGMILMVVIIIKKSYLLSTCWFY